MILRLISRGLATLFIFLLTFVVAFFVVAAIWFYVLFNGMGYDMIAWGPNQAPEWLDNTAFGSTIAIPLAAAAFLGWKFWRR